MDAVEIIAKHCRAGLTLGINEHLSYHETAAQYLEHLTDTCGEIIEPELKERLLKTDSLICFQFYPLTPVGFHRVFGTTVEEVMTKAKAILKLCPVCNGSGVEELIGLTTGVKQTYDCKACAGTGKQDGSSKQ